MDDGWTLKPKDWEEEPPELLKKMNDFRTVNNHRSFNQLNRIELDGIIVLAGGLKNNGSVHDWVMRRLNLAFELYTQHPNRENIKIICSGGGTYHKPPILNKDNYVVHESTACASYLINLGVDPKNIYREWGSYDTIANAYFVFLNFIQPMGFKRVVVITSEFHMPRARTIFNWINRMGGSGCKLYFEAASDNGLSVDERMNREKRSLTNLLDGVVSNVDSFEKFHHWFYQEHRSYSSLIQREEVEQKIKDTY